jgi:predicted HTH transcriptional regulator
MDFRNIRNIHHLVLYRTKRRRIFTQEKKRRDRFLRINPNKPEYAERAVLEAMVNHFIHRDYTVNLECRRPLRRRVGDETH